MNFHEMYFYLFYEQILYAYRKSIAYLMIGHLLTLLCFLLMIELHLEQLISLILKVAKE